jgi:pimeloyl-ACP methyl ester carboxylesterase
VTTTVRVEARFISGGTECAAWHYPGTNGGLVVMAAGFAVTKEPGTDLFAQGFHDAGFSVLAFDHRHLGASGGTPRQVAPIREQLEDWSAALAFASTLPGVEPDRIAAWGFSVSGGHVVRVAARRSGLAAAIAQTPNVDGTAAARNAARYTTPAALARLVGRGVLDTLMGLVGAEPLLVPLVGEPGTVALLSTPDALADGDRALDPDDRYPGWVQSVAARSALAVTTYRPGRDAPRVRCPLLVVVAEQDHSAPPGPAVRAAAAAPRGELVRVPGGHYAPFLDAHERVLAAEVSFLRRSLLAQAPDEFPARRRS